MISAMPNAGLAIELQPAERAQLEQWESAQGTPQQVALRCRIILRAVAGQQNVAIAAGLGVSRPTVQLRSEEHTSELQSQSNLVCRLLLEKKKIKSRQYGQPQQRYSPHPPAQCL